MRGKTVWKYALTLLGALGVGAGTAGAQLTTPTNAAPAKQLGSARVIEWDLPADADFNPGAMVVDTRGEDNNVVWFVTRLGGQKVYRFNLQPSLMKNGGPARWTSWNLFPDMNAGGSKKLRPSHDRRFVIVRTANSIQEIDTQACVAGSLAYPTVCDSALRRFDFVEDPEADGAFVSDIAVDDSRRIFSTGRSVTATGLFPLGYVQMLIPTRMPFTSKTDALPTPTGTVTRWGVPGVDQCDAISGESVGIFSGFCNSGIDFRSSDQNVVYVSNQGQNSIDELNVTNGKIRRWPLPNDADGDPVLQPRMLKVDSNDRVWVVTGSGHLLSLNPRVGSGCPYGQNRITRHRMPFELLQNDGWGIAPDSNVIGYTDANNHKVGMLLPHDAGICEAPNPDSALKEDIYSTVTTVPTEVVSDVATGDAKTVLKQTTKKKDGTFVEAVINTPAPGSVDPYMKKPTSMSPLGITAVKSKAQGTFFYAVGVTAGASANPNAAAGPDASFAKRIGFVRLGVPERINNPRDDDDEDDGYRTSNPGWRAGSPGDADGDGVSDEYDTPSARENVTAYAATPAAAFSATDYAVTTTATTLALVASVQPDDPTAAIGVDIYNAMGLLLSTSALLPGVPSVTTLAAPGAGTFTVRVRNLSGRTVGITPTVLVREPPM